MLLRIEPAPTAWCHYASHQHPDVGLRVLSYFPLIGGGGVEVVSLEGPKWPALVEGLREGGRVERLEILEEHPRGATLRLKVPSCPLPAAAQASGAVPRFPFAIRGGCDEWLVIADQGEARTFVEKLQEGGTPAEVVWSGPYTPEATLTPRQREVLHTAVTHGYYDFPRRITLSDLAGRMGIAKSTLSETLARVEHEILGSTSPP